MIWQIEKKKSMLNPYQQLLWICIGYQFYFYVFGFKIRKRNIGSMASGLSYICYSKKSQSDIFSAGISQSTIISWPLVVKTQKSWGVVVVLLRREWCPVFSDSVHLYHSDPSSRLLTERRILCLLIL